MKTRHIEVFTNEKYRQEKAVLFVDMNGSTELKSGATDAAWLATYAMFFDRIVAALETKDLLDRCNLIKYTGDGLMIVLPITMCTEAAQAAITIQEALLDARMKRVFSCTCSIGIASGTVVEFPTYCWEGTEGADHGSGSAGLESKYRVDYINDTVDRAARLCSYAPANAIWIDAESYAKIGAKALFHRVGDEGYWTKQNYFGDTREVFLKGFHEKVLYYDVPWNNPKPDMEERSDNGGTAETGTEGEQHEPSTRRAMPVAMAGVVRRWNAEQGRGFVITAREEFLYVDRRFLAHGDQLNVGEKVFFVEREPIIEGKNRVAACAIVFGRECRGRVTRVTDKGYGFVHVADQVGNGQSLFMYVGENEANIKAGDHVEFEVGENEKGPIAKSPHCVD